MGCNWDGCLGLSKQPSRLEGTGPHFQGERARKHGACPKTRFAVAGQGREVSVRPLSDVAPFLISLNGLPAVSRLLRARQLALGPYILSLGSARPPLQRPCRCCFQKNRVPLYLPNIFVRPWYSVRINCLISVMPNVLPCGTLHRGERVWNGASRMRVFAT